MKKTLRFATVLIVSLTAVTAFAEAVAVAAPTVKDALLQVFIRDILPVLSTFTVGVLTWLSVQGGRMLRARASESKMAAVAAKVLHFGEVVVHDLEVTLKPQLLIAVADGELTPVEIAQLRAVALERFKALLKQEGLNELQSVLGIGAGMVDTYLQGVLEKAVAGLPASAKSGELVAAVTAELPPITAQASAPLTVVP